MANINNSTEIWKDVKGFEGRYKVSSHGRIISIARGREKLLNPKRPTTQGYYNIALWDSANGCKGKTILVHQLVANAFCEKPDINTRLEIDHKDSNKLNNHFSNLRFLTPSQHKQVSYDKNEMKKGEEHHNSKLTEAQVIEIRSTYKRWKFTRKMLCAKYGLGEGTVQNILERVTWKHI